MEEEEEESIEKDSKELKNGRINEILMKFLKRRREQDNKVKNNKKGKYTYIRVERIIVYIIKDKEKKKDGKMEI